MLSEPSVTEARTQDGRCAPNGLSEPFFGMSAIEKIMSDMLEEELRQRETGGRGGNPRVGARRTSLVIQGLRRHASNVGGPQFNPWSGN